ncbi:MAG: hypothetical protein HDS31_01880 [Bacteroides sp.]|nr:hypothetical protein [Bacteroides sp.]
MKQAITSILRILLLSILGLCALCLLFSEENDLAVCLINKTLGLASAIALGRLYSRWSLTDPWISAHARRCDEELESPNPMAPENDTEL